MVLNFSSYILLTFLRQGFGGVMREKGEFMSIREEDGHLYFRVRRRSYRDDSDISW